MREHNCILSGLFSHADTLFLGQGRGTPVLPHGASSLFYRNLFEL